MNRRGTTALGRKLPLPKTALPMPLRFYPNAAPQGRHRDHLSGISANCAFLDGQSSLPHVHIPQTDLDLLGTFTWTFFASRLATSVLELAVDADGGLVDDEDGELNANGLGRHPFSTGRHPLRKACDTVWLAISSETPDALS